MSMTLLRVAARFTAGCIAAMHPPLCHTDVADGSCVCGVAYDIGIVASKEHGCDFSGPDPMCGADSSFVSSSAMAFPASSAGLSNRLNIAGSQFQERAEMEGRGQGKSQAKHQEKSKAAMTFFGIKLLESVQEYDDVHTFRFQTLEPMLYEAGMYVHMKAPGEGERRQLVRHMSFASAPEESTVAFSMDLASGSAFKKAMSALSPGDTVDLFKLKFKHFELVPELQREVIFLAGGLGITPVRSLLLSSRCNGVDWRLIHVARDGKHLYESELRELPGVQVRTDHQGAASAVLAAAMEKPEAWYYVCGSGRFVEGMESLLRGAGVSSERVRVESFK